MANDMETLSKIMWRCFEKRA